MDPLPWGSQRITVLGVELAKDNLGYVSFIFKLRNDNPVDLRLVTFEVDYWYGLVKRRAAYNPGAGINHHFFAKDEPNLMGIEKIPGAWTSGQVRTFKVELKEILSCSEISIFRYNFNVTQGIGNG
jgi:hypothetical protein